MRRADREMDRDFAYAVIDKADYGVVSMVDTDGNPHGLPLSIVRDGDRLYFHSAKVGEKVDLLANNPKVSISFVGNVRVPELFSKEELEEMARDKSKATTFISSVFTTEYESALVRGQVELVESEEERVHAMLLVCGKYTPSKLDYYNIGIEAGLSRTNIYKLEIESITAKRKKYDTSGNEMKWGRKE